MKRSGEFLGLLEKKAESAEFNLILTRELHMAVMNRKAFIYLAYMMVFA